MSVLKQLKGITKRTIKYLTKDIYDINSDKHLDEIIQDLKKGGNESTPNFVLKLTGSEEEPINTDDLSELFDYIENNVTEDNIKTIPDVRLLSKTSKYGPDFIYGAIRVLSLSISSDLKTISITVIADGTMIISITKTDEGFDQTVNIIGG